MPPESDPVEQAWRIHAATVTWTSGVDSKASFTLAIESGVMLAVIGLAGSGRRLHGIVGTWENVLFYAGVTLLGVALVCVAWVVRPRLRTRHLRNDVGLNFIYFGHLRNWEAPALESALTESDMLPVLSRQIIAMAKVAWFKHRLLQTSLTLAVLGVATIAVVAMMVG